MPPFLLEFRRKIRSLWFDLSLARKGVIVAAIPVVTILLAGIPLVINDLERVATNDALQRSSQAVNNANLTLRKMLEAQNHVLGFIITLDTTQLDEFGAASREVMTILDSTEHLIDDDSTHNMLMEVRARVNAMLADLNHEIELAVRSRAQRTQTSSVLMLPAQESRTTLNLQSAITELIAAEEQQHAQRTAQLHRVRARNVYLASLMLLLGVFGTAISQRLFVLGVARRVERMHFTATNAEGDVRPVVGDDELGQLAVAISENLEEAARIADRLRMAIRAAHIEVIEIRPEQDRLTVVGSGNLFRRMGYKVEEIPQTLGGFIQTIHMDDRERVASSLRNIAPGFEYVVEFRMDAAGLDWRWMELRGASSPAEAESEDARDRETAKDDRAAAVGILLDVTDRKNAEEQVRLAMTAADRANKAKSEFLSRMSHELRTPLNAVLGFAQLLESEALTEDQRESISHILRGGRYLLNLINEVLDLARIEAGRLGLSLEPVSMREVMSAVVALINPQAAEFDIRLFVAPTSADLHVHADRQRLQQVLLNLVSNAIKYNRRGGSVELGVDRGHGMVRLHVKDTGPGMTSAQLDRLFQPFERLDAGRSGVEGTGLGLALSRTIVEAMGGRILVESMPGVGSTFTVELDEAEAPLDDSGSHPAIPAQERRTTVVYVEDNQANVRLVERVMNRRPHLRLVTLADGDRAIQTIRAERPAVVLLDLNLPGLSGDVVLQQLRQDPSTSEVPVAILSADATPSQIARLRSLGAQYYLTKPIDVGSLLEVLDACVAGRSPNGDGTH